VQRAELLKTLDTHANTIRTRFGVRQLALFGSHARDEARAGSDIDMLVEFDGPATFDNYMGLKFFLEDTLGCQVDLVTRKALRPELRPSIEKDAIRVS
jgi:predicted nucleotidyltransferase